MKQTTNLKLKKPDSGDQVLISDLNENADILDAAVNGKLDKSGGTMTGPIKFPTYESMPQLASPTAVAVTDAQGTLGYKSMSSFFTTNENISGGWLQTKSVGDLNAVPPLYPVLRNDKWIYSRTHAEMITDLGIDKKADSTTVTALDKRIKALENIPNANGVSY